MAGNIRSSSLYIEYGEQIAENTARRMLEDSFGSTTFIGAYIEQFVRSFIKSEIIYGYMNDPLLFGGTVNYLNKEDVDNYVFINTYHSSRVQYFTLAHELFHLTKEQKNLVEQIEPHLTDEKTEILEKVVERAADRFAAALLLPENLVRSIWEKSIKLDIMDKEVIIYNLADMSCATYAAVARRLVELKLNTSRKLTNSFKNKILNYKDVDWEAEREKYMTLPSPLDIPLKDIQEIYNRNLNLTPIQSTYDEDDGDDPLEKFL